jgi:hypothetical protein
MPAKKTNVAGIERTPRIRETADKMGTDDDPASFGHVFAQVVRASGPKNNSAEK